MYKLRNILFPALVLLLPLFAQAQALPDPVQFIVGPENPGPEEQVVIVAEGVGAFLGESTITWKENGKVSLTGVGERTFRFTTGALGSQTTILVTINSAAQGQIERTFIFRPSIVNLIWEADTTAPLFYQGKTLYSGGSALSVVAFPIVIVNNSLVSSQSLSFQWSRNDEPMTSQSGLGRNRITFTGDQLQAGEDVRVDVYFGAARVGQGRVTIPAEKPFVLLYERDPLRGMILDQAFPSAISLEGNEITIQAEPYFFSKGSKTAGLLEYQWTLNREAITGPDTSRGLLTLRQSGEGAGAAEVGVEVQNNDPDKFVQAAEAAVGMVFGADASALQTFFGL